jgi:histidine ammonia-lyase
MTPKTAALTLTGDDLRLDDVGLLARPAAGRGGDVVLSSEARARVRESAALCAEIATGDDAVYGINTGFGPLCSKRIAAGDLRRLQANLIVSHAVGVGDAVCDEVVRLMLAIKVNSLAKGFSGVSVACLDLLLAFLNRDILPVVPSQGSVGASGDLAPLAHLSLPLLGLGRVRVDGVVRDAAEVLAEQGLHPIEPQPKEGLALLNGTQFMSAHGCWALWQARRLARQADVNTALCLEALQGSIKPFHARIQEVRPFPGQITVAENVRRLMQDSEILVAHANCSKVQDPYSLRCVPQVHGASRDALAHGERVMEIEINAATDNPLLFDRELVLSGGNFHGQPLALALDFAAMALAEFANISERRTYLLLEGRDGLPALLMRNTGLNSGFMLPQYTSAALVSENKVLCHPASVDSIPTSLGQEDHVSMGSISATKLLRVLRNAQAVLGIELMCAAQGVDYRLPLAPGRGVRAALERVRLTIPHAEEDHLFAPDIEAATALVVSGAVVEAAEAAVGPLN